MNELKKRIRQTFLETIAIDGVYPNEQAITEYVARRFDQENVSWQFDGFRNIIVKIPGTGDPVLLSTHLDIPESTPNVRYLEKGDIIQADGSCILGADPKSGLAVLIEFLIDLNRKDPAGHLPAEAVLTRGEEVGLLGSRNCDYSLLSSKIGLVLDEDGPVTQAVIQAPAFIRVDAEFLGKIVHPREPENGINALEMATKALAKLPWGYIEQGVTWNVGLFESGTARNSVPGFAKMKAELRGYSTQEVVEQSERVKRIFKETAKKYSGEVKIETELEFEGYQLNRDHKLFQRLEKIYSKLGLQPNFFATFGGSDANVFNSNGITTIPLGSGYYNAHQYTEYVNLQDMVKIHAFLGEFLNAE